ncbi:MAG: AsmA-like C-terminal region-containing protein [Bacteroidota bacterium]
MKRALKKLLLWTSLLIGFSILILVILAGFFDQQISSRLLREINKQLNSELTVEQVELSLLSGFPNASVNLEQVALNDAMKGTLLEAQTLAFRFKLFSLFGSTIKIHSVLIENGALFVRINRRGKANYNILKGSKETEQAAGKSDSKLAISLDEARFKDVELIFINEQTKQEAKALIKEAVASGQFSQNQFSLNSFADMRAGFYELDGQRYFAGKDLVYDASIDVDLENGHYAFNDFDLGVESNIFKVNGTIDTKADGTDVNLKLTSKECSLESILNLLPEEQLAYFADLKSKGTFFFNASINGRYNERENPKIDARFGLKNGSISSQRLPNQLKDVTFNATFTNGKKRRNAYSVFEIQNFKGYFNRELIESSLRIADLDHPRIEFKLDGVLPLESVYGLFNNEAITDGDGEIEIKKLYLKGSLDDMKNPARIGRVKSSGELEFDDAALTIHSEEVVFDKGRIQIQDNSLIVEDIKIEGAGSEIGLEGKFLNIIPVLFADSLNSRKAELQFQATLVSPKLDIDRIVDMATPPVSNTQLQKGLADSVKVAQIKERERITKFLKGTFQAKIDDFNYEKIQGENFSGEFEFDNNELLIKGNAKGMDGDWRVAGEAYFEDQPYLNARLECTDIDVKEFFNQAQNFGQQVLLAKNVNGTLDAKLAIDAFWKEDGTYIDDKLHVLGDISLTNGQLDGFKLLYDFSSYIKLQDLRNIRFTKMRNWLEVKRNKIYLPAMFIQSNATNLTISGEHNFENDIDYNIKVNAGQVLFNKFKKFNPRLRPQPAKKKGWFNLYYRIYGNIDEFDVKSDKKGVKTRFNRSERRKRQIQEKLIRIFGSSVDTSEEPSAWKDIPEYDDGTSTSQTEYIEGFEDSKEKVKPTVNKPKPKEEPSNIPEPDDDDEVEYIEWEDDGG